MPLKEERKRERVDYEGFRLVNGVLTPRDYSPNQTFISNTFAIFVEMREVGRMIVSLRRVKMKKMVMMSLRS